MEEAAAPSMATPDAAPNNWVEQMPLWLQPFLRLMRADRPIGTWLLLIPCWWGMAIGVADTPRNPLVLAGFAILFAIGAFVMRGAGCVYNDIVDRNIDAQVSRTANRPLPSGQVKLWQAWVLLVGLCLIGLGVLVQFNKTAIVIGLLSLGLVAAYPFMKRITWWPQAWLGLTFNWGILVAWAAVTGGIGFAPLFLYIAGILWTLGYDTIYAHQDKEDDALIGVKSTARLLQGATRVWLSLFFVGTIFFIAITGLILGMSTAFYWALIVPLLHFAWQIIRLDQDDGAVCLRLFKANRDTGLMILLALLFGKF